MMIPRLKPTWGPLEVLAALRPPRADDVARFEAAFAREMGQRHAVAFPYGRTGLMLLLEALGLRDREVICPAYTCVVVPHAVVYSGNRPVFVDSAPESFNMDLEQAEAAITQHTGALIATSIFGYPVDLDRLDALRRRHPNLCVIQDCAHSFAAEWQGRPVQREGVAAIFGLNISKLMTSIFGGMVTTDDDALAERLRELRAERLHPAGWGKGLRRLLYLFATMVAFWPPVFGLVNSLERSGLLDRFVRYYDAGRIDMPADYLQAMCNVEARVGAVQLGRYREIVRQRRDTAAWYDVHLRDIAGLELPPLEEGATYSHYVPVVEARPPWMRKALKAGVQLGELIEYSVPNMAAYAGRPECPSGCPRAQWLASHTVNLPPYVKSGDRARVASAIDGRMAKFGGIGK